VELAKASQAAVLVRWIGSRFAYSEKNAWQSRLMAPRRVRKKPFLGVHPDASSTCKGSCIFSNAVALNGLLWDFGVP
jgi:hypothetical protein